MSKFRQKGKQRSHLLDNVALLKKTKQILSISDFSGVAFFLKKYFCLTKHHVITLLCLKQE